MSIKCGTKSSSNNPDGTMDKRARALRAKLQEREAAAQSARDARSKPADPPSPQAEELPAPGPAPEQAPPEPSSVSVVEESRTLHALADQFAHAYRTAKAMEASVHDASESIGAHAARTASLQDPEGLHVALTWQKLALAVATTAGTPASGSHTLRNMFRAAAAASVDVVFPSSSTFSSVVRDMYVSVATGVGPVCPDETAPQTQVTPLTVHMGKELAKSMLSWAASTPGLPQSRSTPHQHERFVDLVLLLRVTSRDAAEFSHLVAAAVGLSHPNEFLQKHMVGRPNEAGPYTIITQSEAWALSMPPQIAVDVVAHVAAAAIRRVLPAVWRHLFGAAPWGIEAISKATAPLTEAALSARTTFGSIRSSGALVRGIKQGAVDTLAVVTDDKAAHPGPVTFADLERNKSVTKQSLPYLVAGALTAASVFSLVARPQEYKWGAGHPIVPSGSYATVPFLDDVMTADDGSGVFDLWELYEDVAAALGGDASLKAAARSLRDASVWFDLIARASAPVEV